MKFLKIKKLFLFLNMLVMISEKQFEKELNIIISNAIREDVGGGDYSSLACIPENAVGKAKLLVKEDGIIAGVEFAKRIFKFVDINLKIKTFINDGEIVKYGDVVFHVEGSSQSILKAERFVLNAMQRMSAIATKTNQFAKLLEGTKTKILDTRKTTPGIRAIEKWAVKIGGGENHRFALYDMIMLKDNHIDFAGGIGVVNAHRRGELDPVVGVLLAFGVILLIRVNGVAAVFHRQPDVVPVVRQLITDPRRLDLKAPGLRIVETVKQGPHDPGATPDQVRDVDHGKDTGAFG